MMNAEGKPPSKPLSFDIRHLLFDIRYFLEDLCILVPATPG